MKLMSDPKLMLNIRTSLGLSQADMAVELGYNSKDAISKVERGERNLSGPARKSLDRLAELNGIEYAQT